MNEFLKLWEAGDEEAAMRIAGELHDSDFEEYTKIVHWWMTGGPYEDERVVT